MSHTYMTKLCRKCGVEFQPAGANSRYCSPKCKQKTAECKLCGETFFVTKNAKGIYCSTECHYEDKVPAGSVRPHGASGYMIIKVPKETPGADVYYGPTKSRRWMFHHRYVMQESLGRPLRDGENVHHVNGDKTDNRIENLELWDRPQPTGIRQQDNYQNQIDEILKRLDKLESCETCSCSM